MQNFFGSRTLLHTPWRCPWQGSQMQGNRFLCWSLLLCSPSSSHSACFRFLGFVWGTGWCCVRFFPLFPGTGPIFFFHSLWRLHGVVDNLSRVGAFCMSINVSSDDGWQRGATGLFVGWDWRCTGMIAQEILHSRAAGTTSGRAEKANLVGSSHALEIIPLNLWEHPSRWHACGRL